MRVGRDREERERGEEERANETNKPSTEQRGIRYATDVLFQRGDRLGAYVVDDPIGRGGMAEVYRVRRDGPGGFQKVAVLKVVRESLVEDPKFARLFLREARLAAQIDHPNVVQVYELFEEEEILALAMEYVDGVSLSAMGRHARKRKEPLSIAIAVRIVADVALGLQAAHDATGPSGELLHIVHRDVSPHNILVSRDGHAKVCDFGVAKASEGTVTGSLTLKGKFGYMSPEQAHLQELDARSDIYSLAVVLWELVMNQRMYVGRSDAELLRMTRSGQVPALSDDVPERLQEVIVSALAANPEERVASAGLFRRQLLDAVPDARLLEPRDIGERVEITPTRYASRRRRGSADGIETMSSPKHSRKERTVSLPGDANALLDDVEIVHDVAPQAEVLTARGMPPWQIVVASCLALIGAMAFGAYWSRQTTMSEEGEVAREVAPEETAPSHARRREPVANAREDRVEDGAENVDEVAAEDPSEPPAPRAAMEVSNPRHRRRARVRVSPMRASPMRASLMRVSRMRASPMRASPMLVDRGGELPLVNLE